MATSTPDAELAALHLAYKVMSLPALDLWEVLLCGPVVGIIHEDNTACIAVVVSGKNPTMKYIGRSQGINIQFLFEFLGTPNTTCPNELVKTESEWMVADIHIKGFTSEPKWRHASEQANVFYQDDLVRLIKKHVETYDAGTGTHQRYKDHGEVYIDIHKSDSFTQLSSFMPQDSVALVAESGSLTFEDSEVFAPACCSIFLDDQPDDFDQTIVTHPTPRGHGPESRPTPLAGPATGAAEGGGYHKSG